MFFLIPGEVRNQRCLLVPPWNVLSTYRCWAWVIFTRPGVLIWTCCEQSQLLLTTYFSWEVDKHVLVRSVGLRSPIDGGHRKSSSHANPDAQLHCVSSRPTAFYLDNASESVADFHQVWLCGAVASNHRLSKPHQGPLDKFLGGTSWNTPPRLPYMCSMV